MEWEGASLEQARRPANVFIHAFGGKVNNENISSSLYVTGLYFVVFPAVA